MEILVIMDNFLIKLIQCNKYEMINKNNMKYIKLRVDFDEAEKGTIFFGMTQEMIGLLYE